MSRVPRIRFKGFEEDWEQRKLGEIGIIITGSTPSTSIKYYYTDNSDEGIVWVTPTDIINNITVESEKRLTSLGQKVAHIVPKNTILVTCIASIGKNTMLIDRGSFNQQINGLIPYENKYEPYFLLTESFIWSNKMKSSAPAGTMQIVNRKEFSEIDADIPDKSEQNSVGAFFRTLDHLITLHQSKFFGDILKTIASYTLYWEQRKLGEIAERIVRKNEKLESTLPLTISAQYGLIDQNEFFDKRIASKDVRGYYLIKKGEFAYNKSTSVDAPFGAIKRLDKYKNGVLSTLYILFKVIDDTSTCSDYLVTYYFTDLWHKGIQSIAAEGARNHGLLNIAPNDFFETMLSIPLNVSEQKKVGGFFISLDHLITLHQSKLEKLQKIKKSMLECMFI